MRTQIALLVAAIAAAGAAELIVATTDERDEAYWSRPPAPDSVRVAGVGR